MPMLAEKHTAENRVAEKAFSLDFVSPTLAIAEQPSAIASRSKRPAAKKRTVRPSKDKLGALDETPTTTVTATPTEAVKFAKTFANPALEQAFLEYCQLTCQPVASSAPATTTLAQQIRKARSTEIEWIDNSDFSQANAEEQFLGERLLSLGEATEKVKGSKIPDLPPHLARLCETKLLRPPQEQTLFQRMNYLRYRAHQLQQALSAETSTQWDLQRIDALLRAADWHRDCVVKANMRLVISIVKKFVNSWNAFDDLLSDGIVALMRAVDKFDYGRGFRFSTYATQVVRRNAYRMVVQKQKERMRMSNSLHEADIDISDEERTPSMSEGKWADLRSRLTLLLDHLDRREKLIIRARFSLGGHRRVQTLQRLADKLGVSKERVRQLEKRALDKLRGMADGMQLVELDESNE